MAVSCIQPVVKPVVQPDLTTDRMNSGCSFNSCQTGLYNQFDNRVCSFNTVQHCRQTGCQLTTGLTTGCIVYTNIQPVVKLVLSCKRAIRKTGRKPRELANAGWLVGV